MHPFRANPQVRIAKSGLEKLETPFYGILQSILHHLRRTHKCDRQTYRLEFCTGMGAVKYGGSTTRNNCGNSSFHVANAIVAVDSSHLTASSSAL